MNKQGAPKGNTNALKGDTQALSTVVFRCTQQQKARFVISAQSEGLKLTEWILKTLTASH